MFRKIILTLTFVLFFSVVFAYQSPFEYSYDQGTLKIGAGQELRTDVIVRIPSGHFLYVDKTDLSFTVLDGVRVRSIDLPEGVSHTDPVTKRTVNIYPEGELVISVTLSVPEGMKEGEREMSAMLEFQGCEEKLCLRPEEHILTWKISVGPGGGKVSRTPESVIEKGEISISKLLDVRDFKNVISHGRHIALLVALIAGMLTSLTPCVWPLIPVMLLIIGIHKRGHMAGNLLLSLCLVLGNVTTYSILGVVAAAAGTQIGFLFQHKIFIVLIVLFLVAMSLSMFGLFTIELPHRLQNALTKLGGRGYRGAFLSGISMGLLATPCVGPLLGPMLVWVAAEKEYVFGIQLLATYAFGIGIFYVVIGTFYGTFSHKIHNIKAGGVVKKLLGVVLLIPALYYLNSVIPFSGIVGNGMDWRYDEPEAVTEAVTTNRTLMIVFGARWCPPCMELEHKVLTDKRVAEALKKLIPLHVDATNDSDEMDALLDKYDIVGWPTILFVAPNGKVYDDISVVGKVPTPEEMVRMIEEAASRGR